jgi:choline kinase
MATDASTALAVDVAACGAEEVKVIVRNERIIRISKRLDPADCLGEFVGVARFGVELSAAFVNALETCVEIENEVTDYFERAVDRLCPDWVLTPVDVSDLPCIEIDFPEDLTRARDEILPRLR